MSGLEIAAKEAMGVLRQSLPEVVYLFDAFLRRRAQKFRAISQHGPLFKRASLTAALFSVCALVSYVVYQLDPLDGLPGLIPSTQRALWTALTPMTAALLAYVIVRKPFKESILSTFLNLSLVTCSALVIVPGILSLGGANLSALSTDIANLRAGRGAGTPVYEIYCGTIQERVELDAVMRRLERNDQMLAQLNVLLAQNTDEINANGQHLKIVGPRIEQAMREGHPDPIAAAEFKNTIEAGFVIMRRGVQLQRRGIAVNRQGLAIMDRSLELESRQTTAPYRLLGAYPVAAAFLIIALFAGILIWLFSAIIVWRLIVSPQPTRRRRWVAGTSVGLVFFLLTVGFGSLRSGILEALLQDTPTREVLEKQLRVQFEAAAPLCGNLDKYGLW